MRKKQRRANDRWRPTALAGVSKKKNSPTELTERTASAVTGHVQKENRISRSDKGQSIRMNEINLRKTACFLFFVRLIKSNDVAKIMLKQKYISSLSQSWLFVRLIDNKKLIRR